MRIAERRNGFRTAAQPFLVSMVLSEMSLLYSYFPLLQYSNSGSLPFHTFSEAAEPTSPTR